MEQQSQCGMERHDRILHELLDIGETLLASGAIERLFGENGIVTYR